MTNKMALRGFVTRCSGPDSPPGKEGVSALPAPTILSTEGDWP